jgi:hypothetical protein
MSALVAVGFCATSGGATFGFLLASVLASGKLHDFEAANVRLSEAVRLFLQSHSEGIAPLVPVARDDLLQLQERLKEVEVLLGLRAGGDSRY